MDPYLQMRNARLMSLAAGMATGLMIWLSWAIGPREPFSHWLTGIIMMGIMGAMMLFTVLFYSAPKSTEDVRLPLPGRLQRYYIGATLGLAIGIAIRDWVHEKPEWQKTVLLVILVVWYGARLAMRPNVALALNPVPAKNPPA